MFPEVSCIIPGASRPEQIVSNIGASRLDNLTSVQMAAIKQIYENKIWPEIAKEKW
jgi:aryl-alcohol dehydrogenase-like predicted oxidoreductase